MKPLSTVAVGIILLLTSCAQTTLNTATPVSAVVDVCIENATAADVLAHSRSTFKEGSASYLDSDVFRQLRSTALDHGYRNDQPNTFTVNFAWKGSKRAEVTMATDPHFTHVVLSDEVALVNGHGSYRLGNFVPRHTYYYKVKATGACGTLSSCPLPPVADIGKRPSAADWQRRLPPACRPDA